MSNLLFTTLIIVLLYYFFAYLPQQKKLTTANPPLKHHQSTQTDPLTESNATDDTPDCPGPQLNPKDFERLKKELQQKENEVSAKQKTITNLTKLEQQKDKKITDLQAQVRELAKKPSTNSKGTQTDELTNTLDTLIKDIQALNNSL